MTKIEEILDGGHKDGEFVTFVDIDLQQQIQKYAELYAKKCIEELDGGRCIIEFNKLTHVSSDNSLKRVIQLPEHE